MCVRVVVEVLVVNPAMVPAVAVPFAAMGVAAAVMAWVFYRRSRSGPTASDPGTPTTSR